MRGDTVEGCRTGNMVMSAGQAVSTVKALFMSTQLFGQNSPSTPTLYASALSGFVHYSHFERLDILFGSPLISVAVPLISVAVPLISVAVPLISVAVPLISVAVLNVCL